MSSIFRTRRQGRKSRPPVTLSRVRPMVERLESRLVPSGAADSLFVGDFNTWWGTVQQFDAATGAFQTAFVPGDQRIINPYGMIFGPGHTLLVDDFRYPGVRGEVLESNGQTDYGTAQYLVQGYDEFFHLNTHAPYDPRGICEGPNNTVFVADMGDLGNRDGTKLPGRLIQFDANGNWLRDLAPTGPMAGSNQVQFDVNNGPRGVVIGPDGDLYAAVRSANGLGGEIMRFDPNTGAFLGDFIDSNSSNDLNRPEGLVFGPDGNLYVTSFSADGANAPTALTDTDKILEFDGTTGQYLGKIDLDQIGQPRAYAQALLFGPDGKLFVPITGNGPDTGEVRRYDAGPGTFTHDPYNPGAYDVFIPPSANGGPLQQPWYLTFGNTDPSTLAYKAPNLTLHSTFLDLGTTTYGTAGPTSTYTIEDNSVVGNVLISAPSGVEVSLDGTTWSSSLTLTPTNGALATTTIDVRISHDAQASIFNWSTGGATGGVIKNTDGGSEVDVTVRSIVNPATLTITPAAGQSMVYGDNVPANLSFTVDGLVNNDTLIGTLTPNADYYSSVGDYDYTTNGLYAVAADGSYAGNNYNMVLAADSPTFAVTPAPLTITPDANQSMIYGSAVPMLTYTASGWVNGDQYWGPPLTGNLGTIATAASPVGNYAFTTDGLDAGANYNVVLAANAPTFAVTPATLPVVVTSDLMLANTRKGGDGDGGHGGSVPPLTGTVNGVAFTGSTTFTTAQGDTITVTLTSSVQSRSPVGVYPIVAGVSGAQSGNYLPPTSGNLYVVTTGHDSGTGARNVAFWDNLGNAKLITTNDLAALDQLNLRNDNGSNFDPTTAAQLDKWLRSDADSILKSLSMQLAAMELNVVSGYVKTTDAVYAGGLLQFAGGPYSVAGVDGGGFITVGNLMALANDALTLYSTAGNGDSHHGPGRYLDALEDALEDANNNMSFVQQAVLASILPAAQ